MGKITLSAEVAAILRALPSQTELYGPDGQSLGLFVPDDNVTLEQLRAADAAGGEYTMDDVFKLLERPK